MLPERQGSDEFSPSQQAGLETRHTDQERTLAAMHQLERALESAAPLREEGWRGEVAVALTILGEATAQEAQNADRPDSLLSDVAHHQPRLRNRVAGYGRSTTSCGTGLRNLSTSFSGRTIRSQTSPTCANDWGGPHRAPPCPSKGVRPHLRGLLRRIPGRSGGREMNRSIEARTR